MTRMGAWRPRWWTALPVKHGPFFQKLHELRVLLPPLNFITAHYAYFIVVTMLTSVIFWGSSNPSYSISYTDSLFLVVSAMTEAGLNTVNLSQMTTWQQVLLFLLILFGGAIWVSIWTVVFRLHVFESRFEDIVTAEKARRPLSRPASSRSLSLAFFKAPTLSRTANTIPGDRALQGMESRLERKGLPPDTDDGPAATSHHRRPASLSDARAGELTVQERPDGNATQDPPLSPHAHITFQESLPPLGDRDARTTTASVYANQGQPRRRATDSNGPNKPVEGGDTRNADVHSILVDKTGRNAQFYNLSKEEREKLGGYEYRALELLSLVVPLYFVLWQLLGCISLGAWIAHNKPEAATSNGLGPWWTGIFFGVSAFNNSGMALLDLNVIPFQNSYFVLIVMGAMILAGNTAYPILMRFIFWTMSKALAYATEEESYQDLKGTLQLILRYPRRVYTHMFPARQTWWLLFMVLLLNIIDWVSFEVLNLGNPYIEAIPVGPRIMDGLFQGLAVRSGGFYIVPIPQLYIGLQILYVIMMYISVYPVVITMRHSNVYEERSLGIYADDPAPVMDLETGNKDHPNALQRPGTNTSATSAQRRSQSTKAAQLSSAFSRHFAWHGVGVARREDKHPEGRLSFVRQQIQGQVAHDMWFLVLAILAISTMETRHFLGDPLTYSVFNVIFEVVSAYGTVGLSAGLPNAAYSFSGGWYTGSKLVLCLVMLRGRHRGLPVALDRAVRLPGEDLHRDEEEDWRIRRSMTSRRVSIDSHIQRHVE